MPAVQLRESAKVGPLLHVALPLLVLRRETDPGGRTSATACLKKLLPLLLGPLP